MSVLNVHERELPVPAEIVGALIDQLSSEIDALWPRERWPIMRLDRKLAVGVRGGHGPIRYVVDAYDPGRYVRFRFTAPAGFEGTHAFEVVPSPPQARLRHELAMETVGLARVSWPLVFRPLHDALIEDALDCAAKAVGAIPQAPAWSLRVRALRWVLSRLRRRRRG